MKDKIKEILNKLLEYFKESNINKFGYEQDKLISYEEAQILLDYITNLQTIEQQYSAILSENAELENKITNLQEENKRLKEELQQEKKDFKETNDYCFELKDYKSRNEKAIKCIKDKYYKEEYERKGTFTNKLMNILQGSDKE